MFIFVFKKLDANSSQTFRNGYVGIKLVKTSTHQKDIHTLMFVLVDQLNSNFSCTVQANLSYSRYIL